MSFSPEDLSHRFINAGVSVVSDTLLGVITSNPNIGLLNFGKVIVRRDYTTINSVKILSGCASGHEPAFAGFVGKGLLTAAIQGDVFCSPTASDIFRAIKELSYKQDTGLLVLIQNNTSDRLNFGLAVERARGEGITLRLILVSEDCCCMVNEFQGRRGLSGIFLLQKVAAAMSEEGMELEEIYSVCTELHDHNIISIMFSLQSCTAPNAETCVCAKHINDDEMEIGTGLQGEPGMVRFERTNVKETCKILMKEILMKEFLLDETTTVVILINNLGNNLAMEEFILVKEFVNCIQERETLVARVYHGNFFTALDMRGFSATIMRITDPKILEYLDAPCEATSWKRVNPANIIPTYFERIPSRLKGLRRKTQPGPRLGDETANICLLAVQFVCDALVTCTKQINIYDSESGSGNVGCKLQRGSKAILHEIEKKQLDFHHPRVLFLSFSLITEKSVGGTIGILLSMMFDAAANSLIMLPEDQNLGIIEWTDCLVSGMEVLKSYGKIEFGFGTMLDPLHACCLQMIKEDKEKTDLELFEEGVIAAEETFNLTRNRNRRYPDPGAYAITLLLRALYEGISIRCKKDC